MGNLGGFKSCSNSCTCQQKNIVIPSEFMVNVNETTKANKNNKKKTEDNVKREIRGKKLDTIDEHKWKQYQNEFSNLINFLKSFVLARPIVGP